MSRRASMLAVAVACLLPAASHAGCDLAKFGAAAPNACVRSSTDCVPAFLPEEIRAIGKGAVLETIGLAINDGRATWRALDIERNEVVVVERYAGRRLGQAPTVDKPTARDYLKTVDPEPSRVVDHVRRYPLSPAGTATLACQVTDVGAGPTPPVRHVTDIGSRIYLLRGDAANVTSAIGRFDGAPARFGRAIDDIVARQ